MLVKENGARDMEEICWLPLFLWRKAWLLVFAIGMSAFYAVPGQGAQSEQVSAEAPPNEIRPPHVYTEVQLVRRELELIRAEMGKPRANALSLRVADAEPREVFFQALAMQKKTSRLSFELTRKRSAPSEIPSGVLTPGDVYKVVYSTLQVLRGVKARFGINETVTALACPPKSGPCSMRGFWLIHRLSKEKSNGTTKSAYAGTNHRKIA